jgi:hypothetical protein
MIIVSPAEFTQGSLDKNGLMPVILRVIAGQSPNRLVLSGTIAAREGLNVGSSYLVQVQEGQTDEVYGRQFRHTNLGQISGLDLIKAMKELGSPSIFSVDAKEPEPKPQPEPKVEGAEA